MNVDDLLEEDVEPVLCDICHKEIKVGAKFLEVKINRGVRNNNRGYIKGSQSWATDTVYIHLEHTLYAQVSD